MDSTTRRACVIREQSGCSWEAACVQAEHERDMLDAIDARRAWALANLPAQLVTVQGFLGDTGKVHGPRTECGTLLNVGPIVAGGKRARRFGWDAVPDTRDVRPERDEMRAERSRLWHELEQAGGRGVDLAERIDAIDARLGE